MNEMILNNIGLVYNIVDKYFRKYYVNNYDLKEDLIQEGIVHLVKASKNYKKDSEAKFSTYAYKCIWGQLNRYITYTNKENKYNVKIISTDIKAKDSLERADEFIDTLTRYKNDEYKEIELRDFINKSGIDNIETIIKFKSQGYKIKEISQKTGIKESTIKSRLKLLKNEIKGSYLIA